MIINGIDYRIGGEPNDTYYADFNKVGAYNDDVTGYLKSTISDNWVCIDAGANIGLTSIFMVTCGENVSVLAFEPSPVTVRHLINNLNQNDIYNVTVAPVGLGEERGFVKFIDMPNFGAGSHVKAASNHPGALGVDSIAIKIETLDNFLSNTNLARLDLLKIDTEGYELNVLRGAINSIKKFRPLIIIEFNTWFMRVVQNVDPQHVLMELFNLFSSLAIVSGSDLINVENTDYGRGQFLKDKYDSVVNLMCRL
jgi:FkbM family methyltransferase